MLGSIYYNIPKFYEWLSTTYIMPNVSLLTFIVSCLLISVVVYVVLPYADDD